MPQVEDAESKVFKSYFHGKIKKLAGGIESGGQQQHVSISLPSAFLCNSVTSQYHCHPLSCAVTSVAATCMLDSCDVVSRGGFFLYKVGWAGGCDIGLWLQDSSMCMRRKQRRTCTPSRHHTWVILG